MKQMKKIRGKCYCGKIQFELVPPIKTFSHCHCESCRRSVGAAFVSWISVESNQFSVITGSELMSGYESSPGIIWKFCKNCGSSLLQTTRHTPSTTYITAASLIDSLDRKPEVHFSYEEKAPWLEINDTLPKFHAKTSDLIRERESK